MEQGSMEAPLPTLDPVMDIKNQPEGGKTNPNPDPSSHGLPQPLGASPVPPVEGPPASDPPPAPPLEPPAPDAQANAPTKSIEDAKEFIKQVRKGSLPWVYLARLFLQGFQAGFGEGSPAPPSPSPPTP